MLSSTLSIPSTSNILSIAMLKFLPSPSSLHICEAEGTHGCCGLQHLSSCVAVLTQVDEGVDQSQGIWVLGGGGGECNALIDHCCAAKSL